MAVPKRKISKQRGNSRSSANLNLTLPSLVECPHCHEQKENHRVCKKCGYYDGVSVVKMKTKEKKKAE